MPPLHPITVDCANCGQVGTMLDGRPGTPPPVVHVEGDTVRYCHFLPARGTVYPVVAGQR